MTKNITTVIESKLSHFKRSLSDESEASVTSAVKRFKKCDIEKKAKGNKKQFEQQELVLEKLTVARNSLAIAEYDNSKAAIEEGIILNEMRMKSLTGKHACYAEELRRSARRFTPASGLFRAAFWQVQSLFPAEIIFPAEI